MALKNKHSKVARVGMVAMLQRLLPIFVGSSITVTGDIYDPSWSYVDFSTPLSIVIIIWLAIYAAVIPYEVFEAGIFRHLPRGMITIGDIISWTSSSTTLRDDFSDPSANGTELEGNPLDTEIEGDKSEQWYMEARLRLARKRYHFSLNKRTDDRGTLFTLGIDQVRDREPLPQFQATGLLRHRRRVLVDFDGEAGQGREYRISGAGRFRVLGKKSSEKTSTSEYN